MNLESTSQSAHLKNPAERMKKSNNILAGIHYNQHAYNIPNENQASTTQTTNHSHPYPHVATDKYSGLYPHPLYSSSRKNHE